MKRKLLIAPIALLLTAGCAMQPENKLAWEVKPVVNVRHGMAEAKAQYQLGRIFQSQGRLDAAEIAYGKAIAADPRYADAHSALGVIYAARGELERATAAFKHVAGVSQEQAYLHNNIGYALYLDGRHGEALEALRTAVTLDPTYERAWANLRKVALRAGMTELASLAAQRQLTPAAAIPVPAPVPLAVIPLPRHQELAVEPVSGLGSMASKPALMVTEVPVRQPIDMTGPATPIKVDVAPHAVVEQPAKTARPAEKSAAPPAVKTPGARQPVTARLEVSNANGLNRFATQVSRQFRKEGIRVARITNHRSFSIRQSVIEYRPGFIESALALRDRLGIQVALKETSADQRNSELRLILGKDSLQHVTSLTSPPTELEPTRLTNSEPAQPDKPGDSPA